MVFIDFEKTWYIILEDNLVGYKQNLAGPRFQTKS